MLYKIEASKKGDTTLLKIGFGQPGQNNDIVKEVEQKLKAMSLGGELVLINGPASLPVAVVIAHGICHLFAAVAVYDPKLSAYVVAISHTDKYSVGDLIHA